MKKNLSLRIISFGVLILTLFILVFTGNPNIMQEFIEKERMVDAHTPSPPSTSAKKKSVQDAQNEYVKVLKYGFAAQIVNNNLRIRKLKEQMHHSSPVFKITFQYRIEDIQNQNTGLEEKIANKEFVQSEWDVFLSEFKEDTEYIGNRIQRYRNRP